MNQVDKVFVGIACALMLAILYGMYNAEQFFAFTPHRTWYDCSRYWAAEKDDVMKRYINYMIRNSGVRTLKVDHKSAEQCRQHWRDVALTQAMLSQEMQLGME